MLDEAAFGGSFGPCSAPSVTVDSMGGSLTEAPRVG